jgi:D-alanine transaminase
MTELIWLNGRILPITEAQISVEDRGFQFADGIYEVIRLYSGRPFALAEHLDRLSRSAAGIELKLPQSPAVLAGEIREFITRTNAGEGMIYLQLTRGAAPRNHLFPSAGHPPTLLFYFRPLPAVVNVERTAGVKLLPVADERWQRCWIKSIALLPNVLAKNRAIASGADEAVFIDNGVVTECAASNLFAVAGHSLLTHPVGNKVLPGVTRQALLGLMPDQAGLTVQERAATEAEFLAADELFITSTTREINWVSHWNGKPVRQKCGPVTQRLHAALRGLIVRQTAQPEATARVA